jgi:hypothetical protein
MNAKLIVLDHSTSEVHIYDTVSGRQSEEYEEEISAYGHSHSEVSWMIVDKLKLTIH